MHRKIGSSPFGASYFDTFTNALIFVICTSTKSYQSLTSFIQFIIKTIMECIYFEIRSNYQNNFIHINCINYQIKYVYPWPKWIVLMLCWYVRALHSITRMLLTRINAAALYRQISMHGLELVWSGPSTVPIGYLSSYILMSVWMKNSHLDNTQLMFSTKLYCIKTTQKISNWF